MGHGNLKDDAIIARLTTRCSSAFALIASCWVVLGAQTHVPRPHPLPAAPKPEHLKPSSLFPNAPVWTLALNNQFIAPAAYGDGHAYFSIEGDRIVAYEIVPGTQTWIASARPQMEPVVGGGLLFIVEPDALTALNAADGAVAWQLPFAEKLSVRPVFDNGWLVIATEPGEILAFRASDGFLVWRRDLK